MRLAEIIKTLLKLVMSLNLSQEMTLPDLPEQRLLEILSFLRILVLTLGFRLSGGITPATYLQKMDESLGISLLFLDEL